MPISSTRAALVLALSCMLAATPTFAAPDGQSAVVRFSDLNLATHDGELALRRRVSRATRLVCGDADVRDLRAMSEMAACRTTAMASAAPQVQLAIANAHNGMAYATISLKVMSAPS